MVSNETKQILNISKASNTLPLQYGPKCSTYLGEEVDYEKRDLFYVDLSTVLGEERVCRRSCLLTADWLKEDSCTVVDKIKGSTWQRFGHTNENGKKVLHAEEALFLVDQGLLEIRSDETPISLQEAFSLLLPCLPSLEYYKVFAYLNRAGYRVQRWKPTSARSVTIETDEKQSRDQIRIVPHEQPHYQSTGAGAVLWGSHQPLVHPEDATSQADLMPKLQIIQKSTIEDQNKNALYPHFNVYNANSKSFKKTSPGQPLFATLVYRYNDEPPSDNVMFQLLRRCENTPLKYAVVGLDAITVLSVLDPRLSDLDIMA